MWRRENERDSGVMKGRDLCFWLASIAKSKKLLKMTIESKIYVPNVSASLISILVGSFFLFLFYFTFSFPFAWFLSFSFSLSLLSSLFRFLYFVLYFAPASLLFSSLRFCSVLFLPRQANGLGFVCHHVAVSSKKGTKNEEGTTPKGEKEGDLRGNEHWREKEGEEEKEEVSAIHKRASASTPLSAPDSVSLFF